MEDIKFTQTPKCKDCFNPTKKQFQRPGCYGCYKKYEQGMSRNLQKPATKVKHGEKPKGFFYCKGG